MNSSTLGTPVKTKNLVLQTLRRLFNQLAVSDNVEFTSTKKGVNDVLEKLLRDRNIMASITKVRSFGSYAFDHSVNVCMLSLLIGLHIKLSREELCNLGIGALLHDIGMEKVEKQLLYKAGVLSLSEMQAVQKHPFYGYQMLINIQEIPEEAALIAWQHHERLDGSGYPRKLQEQETHEFAKIVAIADVFDALLADRPFRNAFYPHQAVDIIAHSTGKFSPDLVKILLDKVVIYPIGTQVVLNNGETGIVVDKNKGNHARPIIRKETTERRKFKVFDEIDLSKREDLYIVQAVRPEE